ncbi:MAG: hypothetical protein QOH06_5684 [Acidobacteriota bacterium]|jgi:ActR/RegA family two-component response regulator|nr:hypothetical protein [Acidobacteriota bacterium]
MPKVILLLDDEPSIRKDLGEWLTRQGFAVHKAETLEEAKKLVLSEPIDFAIVDLKVDYQSEFGGLDVLNFIRRHQPRSKTIVLSGYDLSYAGLRLGEDVDGFVSKKGRENYIESVLALLEQLGGEEPARTCFVIMPFSDTLSCKREEWTEIFEQIIRPSVEDCRQRFSCIRSNPIQGSIIEDILDNLNRADLVVADLTDRNPNVFYELGVRHSLRDATILIAQRIDDIPFDLRHYAIQTYEWKLASGREQFRKRMQEIIGALETDPKKGASPVRRYLQL